MAPPASHPGSAVVAEEVAGLALELRGVDVRDPGLALSSLVEERLAARPLLVFRDQRLEPRELVDALSGLGPLERYDPPDPASPDVPEIAVVSNDPERGMVPSPYWHVDGLPREHPPRLTAFHAVEVPSSGGETMFIDTRALFEELPEEERDELRALEGILSQGGRYPIVRRDPVLHREAICVNFRHTVGFTGVERAPAEGIIRELATLFDDPARIYVHRYEQGDLLIWNNYALAHSATNAPDASERRFMRRVDVRLRDAA